MAISISANTLALNSVIAATLDKITHISISNVSGEFFRKAVTDIAVISTSKKAYTFYLSESEGNGLIVAVGLCGNGATTTLNSGTTYATQALTLTKTSMDSLNLEWKLEVI